MITGISCWPSVHFQSVDFTSIKLSGTASKKSSEVDAQFIHFQLYTKIRAAVTIPKPLHERVGGQVFNFFRVKVLISGLPIISLVIFLLIARVCRFILILFAVQ